MAGEAAEGQRAVPAAAARLTLIHGAGLPQGAPVAGYPLAAAAAAPRTAASVQQLPRDKLGPTSDEWERMKPTIKSLYIERGMTLSRVVKTMEALHGFKANERMYKGRFNKWGFRKNQPRSTTDASRLQQDPVALDAVDAVEATDSADSADVADAADAADAAGTVGINRSGSSRSVTKTPNATMPVVLLHVSMESQMKEEIFLSINYVAETFYGSYNRPDTERFAIANFISHTRLGLRQMALRNQVFGSRMLTLASGLLNKIHLCRNPPNIINVCFVLPNLMVRLGQRELFADYIANISQVARAKGPHNPIHQILSRLSRLLLVADVGAAQVDAVLMHLSDSSVAIYLEKQRSQRSVLWKKTWDELPNAETNLVESVRDLDRSRGSMSRVASG